MMRAFLNERSGFTLVETLIAFSIAGIFLALTWGMIQFLLQQSQTQVMRSRAHFLAVEGLEVVRHLRDSAVFSQRETGFESAIGSKHGDYVITENQAIWSLSPGNYELIEIDDFPPAFYCRTVHFYDESPGLKEVGVDVFWSRDSDCTQSKQSVYYSTYLADTRI